MAEYRPVYLFPEIYFCELYGYNEVWFQNLKQQFYKNLGIKEDKEKLRYYILLDALF